jgi:hypothetical protein
MPTPIPTGPELLALCVSPGGELLAVGNQGTAIAWRDGVGRRLAVGATESLTGVWCGPEETWLTAGWRILRGRGDRFVELPSQEVLLSSVWGRGPDDVWFTGVRYGGGAVDDLDKDSFQSRWQSTTSGVVLHWNGQQLVDRSPPGAPSLVAISGDRERVIVGGEAPVVWSWEGGQWVSLWRKPSWRFGTHGVCSLTPHPSAFTFVAAGTTVEDTRRGLYRGYVMVSTQGVEASVRGQIPLAAVPTSPTGGFVLMQSASLYAWDTGGGMRFVQQLPVSLSSGRGAFARGPDGTLYVTAGPTVARFDGKRFELLPLP